MFHRPDVSQTKHTSVRLDRDVVWWEAHQGRKELHGLNKVQHRKTSPPRGWWWSQRARKRKGGLQPSWQCWEVARTPEGNQALLWKDEALACRGQRHEQLQQQRQETTKHRFPMGCMATRGSGSKHQSMDDETVVLELERVTLASRFSPVTLLLRQLHRKHLWCSCLQSLLLPAVSLTKEALADNSSPLPKLVYFQIKQIHAFLPMLAAGSLIETLYVCCVCCAGHWDWPKVCLCWNSPALHTSENLC
eukprot:414334-Pelagomonas_calceolata.AAC.5